MGLQKYFPTRVSYPAWERQQFMFAVDTEDVNDEYLNEIIEIQQSQVQVMGRTKAYVDMCKVWGRLPKSNPLGDGEVWSCGDMLQTLSCPCLAGGATSGGSLPSICIAILECWILLVWLPFCCKGRLHLDSISMMNLTICQSRIVLSTVS